MFHKTRTRTITSAAVTVLVAGALAACSSSGGGSSAGGGGDKITFVGNWSSPNVLAIPVVTSIERGYYKQAGIDLKLLLPPNNSTDQQLVGTGQAQLGASTNTDVLNAKQAKLPIVAIANESATNNWGIYYNEGTDLDAKTLTSGGIGGYGDTFTNAMLPFFFKHFGVKASDAKVVTVTNDDIPLLLTNKIKFATSTTNFGAVEYRQTAKKEPKQMLATEVGAPDSPIWVYIGNTKWLASHKKLATKFLDATLKGTEWAVAHQTEAVNLYRKHFKSTGYSIQHDLGQWKATAAILKGPNGYFTGSADQWGAMAKALKAVGALKTVESGDSYFTNDYISSAK